MATTFRLAVHLTEASKHLSYRYRIWNSLIAQDCAIIEEHDKAGSLLCEWHGLEEDLDKIRNVPGVSAIVILPPLEPDFANVTQLSYRTGGMAAQKKRSFG